MGRAAASRRLSLVLRKSSQISLIHSTYPASLGSTSVAELTPALDCGNECETG